MILPPDLDYFVVVMAYAAAGAVMCELCDRLFHERVDYKHHFKHCHLGQFNIRCVACYKGFWKQNALRQHACYPEMHDENVQLQREQEKAALRRRGEVRAAMGLSEDGAGIDVVDVIETAQDDPDQLQDGVSECKMVETSSLSARDLIAIPTQETDGNPDLIQDGASKSKTVEILSLSADDDNAIRSVEKSVVVMSQNISKMNVELLPDSDNSHSNTASKPEADTLLNHGYSTRKKRISFRELLQCS